MPRIERTDVGGYVYHISIEQMLGRRYLIATRIINFLKISLEERMVADPIIFDSDKDYQLFENILEEAAEKFGMRILSY